MWTGLGGRGRASAAGRALKAACGGRVPRYQGAARLRVRGLERDKKKRSRHPIAHTLPLFSLPSLSYRRRVLDRPHGHAQVGGQSDQERALRHGDRRHHPAQAAPPGDGAHPHRQVGAVGPDPGDEGVLWLGGLPVLEERQGQAGRRRRGQAKEEEEQRERGGEGEVDGAPHQSARATGRPAWAGRIA